MFYCVAIVVLFCRNNLLHLCRLRPKAIASSSLKLIKVLFIRLGLICSKEGYLGLIAMRCRVARRGARCRGGRKSLISIWADTRYYTARLHNSDSGQRAYR